MNTLKSSSPVVEMETSNYKANSKSALKSLFQPSLFHLTMRSLDLFPHNIFIYSTSHYVFVIVQLLSLVQLFVTSWTAAH